MAFQLSIAPVFAFSAHNQWKSKVKRMGFSNSKLFALNECDARYPGLLNRALDRGAPVINHLFTVLCDIKSKDVDCEDT